MEQHRRRSRGEHEAPGVIQNEILLFLLLRHDAAATEPEIRDHIAAARNVTDRKTVRNHLDRLKSGAQVLVVAHRTGLDNIWRVAETLAVPAHVRTAFERDALADIFRAPFFRRHIDRWYREQAAGLSFATYRPGDAVPAMYLGPAAQEGMDPNALAAAMDALAVSPTLFFDVFSDDHSEGRAVQGLLLVTGKEGASLADLRGTPTERLIARTAACLMIDFSRYPPLRAAILRLFTGPAFQQVIAQALSEDARAATARCLDDGHLQQMAEGMEAVRQQEREYLTGLGGR